MESNRTGVSGAYPLLAGDGAVPDHEVHRPVGQRLRPRHEPLRDRKRIRSRLESGGGASRGRKGKGGPREAGTDVGVVLAPGLALLGEAAASDSPRHDYGCFPSPPDRLASGLGSFGVGLFRDCANDVPLRPFLFNHALFSFFLPVFFCIFFTFFSGKWAPSGKDDCGVSLSGSG